MYSAFFICLYSIIFSVSQSPSPCHLCTITCISISTINHRQSQFISHSPLSPNCIQPQISSTLIRFHHQFVFSASRFPFNCFVATDLCFPSLCSCGESDHLQLIKTFLHQIVYHRIHRLYISLLWLS